MFFVASGIPITRTGLQYSSRIELIAERVVGVDSTIWGPAWWLDQRNVLYRKVPYGILHLGPNSYSIGPSVVKSCSMKDKNQVISRWRIISLLTVISHVHAERCTFTKGALSRQCGVAQLEK